jgi:membrane associated rhomboid family serine protease
MFVLLPYAHESMSFRRIPYVTIAIASICFVVQVLNSLWGEDLAVQRITREQAVQMYLLQHPHLPLTDEDFEQLTRGLPKAIKQRIRECQVLGERYRADPRGMEAAVASSAQPELDLVRALDEAFRGNKGSSLRLEREVIDLMMSALPSDTAIMSHLVRLGHSGELDEIQKLAELRGGVEDARARDPYLRFGLLAGKLFSIRGLAHMFLHGGWMHLIGNMLFLWLVGWKIEDHWGRMFFAGFYVLGGVAAAVSHLSILPESARGQPMVGASGAISAVMGAFLILYATTRIKIFWGYWFFLAPRYGTFFAPAYVVFPAWLLEQLFSAWVSGGHANVAYFAHIGGFAFGAATAGLLRVTRIDQRFLHGKTEREDIVFEASPEVLRARQLVDQGAHADATVLARAYLARAPEDLDALRLLIEAYLGAQAPDRAAQAFADLVAVAARKNEREVVLNVLTELGPKIPRETMALDRRLRVAMQLRQVGLREPALAEYESIIRQYSLAKATLPAVIAFAELLIEIGGRTSMAESALLRARAIAEDDPQWTSRIDALLPKAAARAQAERLRTPPPAVPALEPSPKEDPNEDLASFTDPLP